MNTHALTHVGRERDTNEDSVLVDRYDPVRLLVVADGMGGHSAGDVASECAATAIAAHVGSALESGRTDYEAVLDEAIDLANGEIRQEAQSDAHRAGMGTTVVAALVVDGEATIATVGDSRAYHIEDGITRITTDQSLVQELVDQGEITESEARTHPQRNVVSQALGTDETVAPDFYAQPVAGTLLLCSDGLTEEVPDPAIAEIVTDASSLELAAERLVERANANGGSDNVSVVLYDGSEA